MAQSRSLGGQVEAVVRALAAFEPGVYSGAHCAELVKTFTRAEKALAVAAHVGGGTGGGVQRAQQGRVRGSVGVVDSSRRDHRA